MCGLTAAKLLSESGMRVSILEKSRGVGGRLATRRTDAGVFDHGAQSISIRSETFGAFVTEWHQRGLLVPWADGFADTRGQFSGARQSHFRGVPGMIAVPKFLAAGLRVHLSQRASRAEVYAGGWRVTTAQGATFSADALLITAPVPQGLALLDRDAGLILSADLATLRQIAYHSSFAVLFTLAGESAIPPPGGLHVNSEVVSWIADNRQKGVSPDATAITVHTTPTFSAARFEASDEEIVAAVTAETAGLLGSSITGVEVHRWRFSEPKRIHPDPCMLASRDPVLLFAGDAFGGPHIEGATLSGVSAARQLLSLSY
jgi:renalase